MMFRRGLFFARRRCCLHADLGSGVLGLALGAFKARGPSNAAVLARFLGKARLLTPAACALAVERARVRCALSRALVHARAFRCLCS